MHLTISPLAKKLRQLFTPTELQLLQHCQLAADLPISEIARCLQISEHSARYSLKRLQERQLVSKYTSVCSRSLGKFDVVVLITLSKLGIDQKAAIKSFIIHHSKVRHCSELLCPYDFGVVTLVDEPNDAYTLLREMADLFGSVLARTKSAVALTHHELPLHYTEESESFNPKVISGISTKSLRKIDDLDSAILSTLGVHSSMSQIDLAKKLRVPLATLRYRIHSLRKAGIIVGQYWILNPATTGLQLYFLHITVVNLSTQRRAEFLDFCTQQGCISFVHELIGAWDLTLGVWAGGPQDASIVISRLKSHFLDIIVEIEAVSGLALPKLHQLELGQIQPKTDCDQKDSHQA
jgi:DNA-binding Lrp family transcriptional regulator